MIKMDSKNDAVPSTGLLPPNIKSSGTIASGTIDVLSISAMGVSRASNISILADEPDIFHEELSTAKMDSRGAKTIRPTLQLKGELLILLFTGVFLDLKYLDGTASIPPARVYED